MAYISNKEIKAIIKNNNKTIKELNKKNKSFTDKDYKNISMKDNRNVVEFDNLHTYFFTDNGVVKAVNGVSFEVPENSIVGIVGESGCGKSVTSLSLMRLLQAPMGQIVDGSIRFKAIDNVYKKNGLLKEAKQQLDNDLNRLKQTYQEELSKFDKNDDKIKELTTRYNEDVLNTKQQSLYSYKLHVVSKAKENLEKLLAKYKDEKQKEIDDLNEKNNLIKNEKNKKIEELDKEDENYKIYLNKLNNEYSLKISSLGTLAAIKRKYDRLILSAKVEYRNIVKEQYDINYSQDIVYDVAKTPIKEMYNVRGKDMTMIFQEPMTSLNPVFTIGNQLDEVSLLHNHFDKKQSKERSIEMLNLVGIPDAEMVYSKFPHELSGGMRQRVMIAMALAANPRLIIADEPTTALDVTIQAQILDLLRDIKKKTNSSIMLITHDLGVIAEMADYVIVMYAGRIIEKGTVMEIFDNPMHPYTIGLQKSKPRIDGNSNEPLFSIPGNVPNPVNMPSYCYFKNRCDRCIKKCDGAYPNMVQVSPTHFVSCYLADMNKKGGNE